MNYSDMKQAMEVRISAAGFPLGTPVIWKGRAGVVGAVNPFFHDMADPSIYVDLQPKVAGQISDRRLIRTSELIKELEEE